MVNTYAFLLVPWVKLFGASLRSIRSADIASMTVALFLLWSAVKRFNIVTAASWRLLLLPLIATEFGVIFSYRSGRYDGFGMLLMSVALWLMSVRKRRARLISLFLLCSLVPWAGPQYLPVLLAAGLTLLLLFRRRYLEEVVSSFVASAIGGAIFLAILFATGRLKGFLNATVPQIRGPRFVSALVSRGEFHHHNYIPKDFSFLFLFGAAIVLYVFFRRRKHLIQCPALSYGILFVILLGGLLLLLGKFPTYYSYMIAVPLAVSVCSGLSTCGANRPRSAALLLCTLSSLAGAGLNSTAYAFDYEDHDYSYIEKFIADSVRANDVAWVDPQVYLATRQRVRDAYFPVPDWDITTLMSQEQKDSITVLIIPAEWFDNISGSLGGTWQETGKELVPVEHSMFGNRNLGFVTWKQRDHRVFRRRNALGSH